MADAVERLYKLSVEGGQAITEMKRIAKASDDTAKQVAKFRKDFADLRNTVLAGLTFKAVVEGFKGIVNAMSDIKDQSEKLGVTTEEFQRLSFAAQQSGVSATSLATGIKKLQIGMQELNDPTSKQGALLKQLGVTTGDTVTTAFRKIAIEFKKTGDEGKKVAVITGAMGKSANELIPIFKGGAEALDDFNKQADQLGLIVDDATINKFEALGDNFSVMGRALGAVGVQIVSGMLPAFLAITKTLLDAAKAGDTFKNVGTSLGEFAVWLAEQFIKLWVTVKQFVLGIVAADEALGAFFSFEFSKSAQIIKDWVADTNKAEGDAKKAINDLRLNFKKFKDEVPETGKATGKLNVDLEATTAEAAKQAKILAQLQFEYATLTRVMSETDKLNLKIKLGLVEYNKEQEKVARGIAQVKDVETRKKALNELVFEYEKLLVEMNELDSLNLKVSLGLVKYTEEELKVARALAARKDADTAVKESTEKKTEADKKALEAVQKYNDVLKQQEDNWTSLLQTIDPVLAKEEQHRLAMEQLNMMYGVLKMSSEEYEKRLKQIDKAFGPEKAVTALTIIDDNFQAFFKNMENGTADVEDAFKRMVQSIIAQLLKLLAFEFIKSAFGIDLAKAGKTAAKGMIVDPLGNVQRFASGGVTVTHEIITRAAKGMIVDPLGNVQRFATGGVITSPIMFPLAGGRVGMAGEAGTEAVFPLTRTASGDLAVKGEAPIVNVTVVNNHPDATVQVQKNDDGSRIDIMIDRTRRALANDVRTGGTMFSSAIESTYALGRARS
jgi:hypothetical protein